MRPKFRAWDTIRKKMWSPEEMAEDQLTLMPDGTGFINVSGTSTKSSRLLPHLIPLQSTGLTDKNGKEIYEGDIANVMKTPRIAKWGEAMSSWIWSCPLKCGDFEMFCKYLSWQIEVIGNLHDNPELLEVQK